MTGKLFSQLNQLAEMNPISQQYLRKGGPSSEVCLIFPSACLVVRLSYNLTIQTLNNHLSRDVPVMVSFIFYLTLFHRSHLSTEQSAAYFSLRSVFGLLVKV